MSGEEASASSLPAGQVLPPGDPAERLVIVKVPREGRPFTRENVVEALIDFGLTEFEAVGRFARGLEFQVLFEHQRDADTLAEMGYIEISNARGDFGCATRKFTQREYRIRVDWLPAVTTEQEVGDIFRRYGNVIKVYKEMAPQYKEHPRYWGGTFIVCIVARNEEEVSAIPDFQDVNIRGRTYSMLSVVLGLPPRCHRCKVRGHLARNCVACRYCGSAGHTSEEHSAQNARRRTFTEVAGGNRGTQDYEVEDGSMEEGQETPLQQPVIDSQPGPMTQLLQDSQGEGDVTAGDGGKESHGGDAEGKEEGREGDNEGNGGKMEAGSQGNGEGGQGAKWEEPKGKRRRKSRKREGDRDGEGVSRSRSRSGGRDRMRDGSSSPSPGRRPGGRRGGREGSTDRLLLQAASCPLPVDKGDGGNG